nr:MAG TPA: Protein of unknown function (DUF4227) [Caudoviricetes sp.]
MFGRLCLKYFCSTVFGFLILFLCVSCIFYHG